MENFYDKNKELLTEHFENASKANAKCLGIELEHFLLYDDDTPADYYGEHGVLEVLKELTPFMKAPYYVDDVLLGLYAEGYSISLEPASQFEISVMPQCCSIDRIEKIYADFRALADPILRKHGLRLETLGYRPKGRAADLPLIPKKRYEYMDRYFKTSGEFGLNMMRGTASTQVSIDYTNEADFVKKYRLAYILMPALKLICDNTPLFEDGKNKIPLRRTLIWRGTDPDRCSPPADLFDEGFGFTSYADYLMNVPLIFVPKDGRTEYVGNKSAAVLYKDRLFDDSDIDHVLSMVFPDVRLKSYVEIRGADSLPIKEALGYTALIKALFYYEDNLQKYLNNFGNIRIQDITAAEDSIINNGYAGEIYGISADEFISGLFADADAVLSEIDRTYLKNLSDFYLTSESRGMK